MIYFDDIFIPWRDFMCVGYYVTGSIDDKGNTTVLGVEQDHGADEYSEVPLEEVEDNDDLRQACHRALALRHERYMEQIADDKRQGNYE